MNTVYSKILKVSAHVVSLSILGQVQRTEAPPKGQCRRGPEGRPRWPGESPLLL